MDTYLNNYMSDIILGLAKEAAFWRSKYDAAKTEQVHVEKTQFTGTEDSLSEQKL
jgi:hypothetical protein